MNKKLKDYLEEYGDTYVDEELLKKALIVKKSLSDLKVGDTFYYIDYTSKGILKLAETTVKDSTFNRNLAKSGLAFATYEDGMYWLEKHTFENEILSQYMDKDINYEDLDDYFFENEYARGITYDEESDSIIFVLIDREHYFESMGMYLFKNEELFNEFYGIVNHKDVISKIEVSGYKLSALLKKYMFGMRFITIPTDVVEDGGVADGEN